MMTQARTEEPEAASAGATRDVRRHWLLTAVRRALGDAGARWGAAWVLVITFLAAFAPFIAHSKPYLLVQDDNWSSPLLAHLSWVDALLPVLFIAAAVLFYGDRIRGLRRTTPFQRCGVFVLVLLLAGPLAYATVSEPRTVVYERERELAREGEVDFAVWAPVHYSPQDRLRDQWDLSHPLPPSWVQLWGGDAGGLDTWAHPLGTDRYGSDILSNMIHASRVALAVGFIATSISLLLGVLIGGIMGYFGGLVDLLGLRLVEIFNAIPQLFLLLMCVAVFGRNIYLVMLIIGLTSWVGFGYFVRAEFLKLRRQDFVVAAIATAAPLRSVLFRHMLPNGMSPVLVNTSFGFAQAILLESMLSFLGVGVLGQASWGELLNQAISQGGGFYWWLASFPGLAIFLAVFSFMLLGEAMRDAIDPRTANSDED